MIINKFEFIQYYGTPYKLFKTSKLYDKIDIMVRGIPAKVNRMIYDDECAHNFTNSSYNLLFNYMAKDSKDGNDIVEKIYTDSYVLNNNMHAINIFFMINYTYDNSYRILNEFGYNLEVSNDNINMYIDGKLFETDEGLSNYFTLVYDLIESLILNRFDLEKFNCGLFESENVIVINDDMLSSVHKEKVKIFILWYYATIIYNLIYWFGHNTEFVKNNLMDVKTPRPIFNRGKIFEMVFDLVANSMESKSDDSILLSDNQSKVFPILDEIEKEFFGE